MPAVAQTTVAVTPQAQSRWRTAAVLLALAGQGMRKGSEFTSRQLRAWVPELKTGTRFHDVMDTMHGQGFVRYAAELDPADHNTVMRYTVTAEGAEAIKAAAAGKAHKSGPKGPHTANRTVPPATFAARLWALMRARKILETDTAAATLVDAGGDVAKAAKTAQRYLARWASTGAIAPSRQRMPNGCKRYVLITDTPMPPAWTAKARARANPSQQQGNPVQ